jgi:hypothetical protein
MINQMQQFQPFQPTYQPISDLRFMNVPFGANQTISELMLPFGEQTLQGLSDFSTGFSPDYAPKYETENIEEAVKPQNVAKNVQPYSYKPDSLYNFQPPDYSLGGVGALIGGYGGAKKAYEGLKEFDSLGDAFSTFGQNVGDAYGKAGDFFGGMFGGSSPETLYGLPEESFSGMMEQAYGASGTEGLLGGAGAGPEFGLETAEAAGGAGQSHPYLAYLNIFLDTLSGGEGSKKISGNTYVDSVARAAAAYYSFGLSEIFYAIL